MSADDKPLVLPPSVRWAGWIGMIEGLAGFGAGVYMVVREVQGEQLVEGVSGYATAAWFLFFGAVIAVAGLFLSLGRRWGRGPVAMLQLLLVLVAFFMLTSGRFDLALPTAALGFIGLALMFNPSAVEWAARRYRQ